MYIRVFCRFSYIFSFSPLFLLCPLGGNPSCSSPTSNVHSPHVLCCIFLYLRVNVFEVVFVCLFVCKKRID